ncbi:hypothetical protein BGX31_002764, partial [Mortierella sp. GBA43]
SPMEPCEKELYRSLQDVLGPAIAPVIGKAIIDGLPVVAAGSLCTISQTIGTIGKDVADNLVHGIQGLAVAVTEADKDYWKGVMYTALGAAIGFALAPVVLQLIVGALGFGAGGIAGGTPAAALMASYGGHVTVGSLCAGLQSIGAAGLGASAAALANLGGAAIGGAVGAKLGDFHLDDVLKIKEKLVERTDRWLSGKGA